MFFQKNFIKIIKFHRFWNSYFTSFQKWQKIHLAANGPATGAPAARKRRNVIAQLGGENSGPSQLENLKPTKICDIKNFFDKIWWFCENLEFGKFVKFEILNPSENQNLKSLTLDTQNFNFWQKFHFLMNFDEKFDENWKFEILNPKIQNLTKSQNLKSLTLKSKIFNFDKIWQKIKIPPRWFIITLRFHQNSMVKIFQNLSQYGRTRRHKIFSKFWSRYQNHQNLQNWLKSPKFWRKFLKPRCDRRTFGWSGKFPAQHVKIKILNFTAITSFPPKF